MPSMIDLSGYPDSSVFYGKIYVHFVNISVNTTLRDTMLISRKIEIDYGHTLPNSFTFCNQLHGHRGVIVATVEGPVIDRAGDAEEGMVIDFKFLRQIMDEHIHDQLDHGFAVWKEDKEDLEFILKRNTRVLVTDAPPTAECLARWAFNQISGKLPEGVILKNLRWYETPNNWADYTGG
ncbi:MAG TPA: 6-carboxytetrahydropterin synthase [Chlorobaculum sp.]|uniref:6-carboxy-5,6,7,8-tetrahydropterin synthase n=2 Tax=Chlorobaculum tepidum TaxID=1097 RepID=Q8KCI4_CHLTE|nr:6-pyruvoyl tetrahydrobiopterin synthase, putative [Chlorobaculum tepidum TLS]HBU22673.1 6-carboxytetrahydropterin synthase [Chlorobaculum sp.]